MDEALKDTLGKRRAELEKMREQAIANLNAIAGALTEVIRILEPPSEPTPDK